MANVLSKVAKNTLVQLITSGATIASSMVIVVMLGRLWGAEELGKYSFVTVSATMFTFSCDWGLNRLIIREVARERERVTKYMSNSFTLGLIFSALTMISMSLIINLMGRPLEIRLGVYLAGLWVVLGVFGSFFRGAFHAFERMEYETIALLVEKAFAVTLGLLVVFMQWGLVNLLIVLVVSRIVNIGVSSMIYVRKVGNLGLEVDWTFWKSLVRSAFPFGLNLLLTPIYARIDVVMLSLMRGDQDVGFYSAATALVLQLPALAITLNNSLLPIMSRSYVSGQGSFKIGLEKSFEYLLTLGLPMMIGICLLADRFIFLFYDEAFSPSIISLQILSAIIPLRFAINTLGMTLTSSNRQGLRTIIVALAAASNLVMNMFLIPRLGYIGASITTVLTDMILFISFYSCVSKLVCRLSLPTIAFRPVLSGLAMAIFIYFFAQISLPILIGASAVVYLVVLHLLGGFPKDDLDQLKESLLAEHRA